MDRYLLQKQLVLLLCPKHPLSMVRRVRCRHDLDVTFVVFKLFQGGRDGRGEQEDMQASAGGKVVVVKGPPIFASIRQSNRTKLRSTISRGCMLFRMSDRRSHARSRGESSVQRTQKRAAAGSSRSTVRDKPYSVSLLSRSYSFASSFLAARPTVGASEHRKRHGNLHKHDRIQHAKPDGNPSLVALPPLGPQQRTNLPITVNQSLLPSKESHAVDAELGDDVFQIGRCVDRGGRRLRWDRAEENVG
jgi:hypothetical protein